MLWLPNELLSRIAEFTLDEDIPSLRLTCKHLKRITSKHFISAFVREIHFSTTFEGIQRLEQIVQHAEFGPSIERCMATVDGSLVLSSLRGPVVRRRYRERLLRIQQALSRIAHHEHGLELGITCRHQSSSILEKAWRAATLMSNAKPTSVILRSFIIDLEKLSVIDIPGIRACLTELPTFLINNDLIESDVIVRFPNRGEATASPSMPQLITTRDGTCIKLSDMVPHDDLHCLAILWLLVLGDQLKELHIISCKLLISDFRLLFSLVVSHSLRLEIKDCQFDHTWTEHDSNLLKEFLCCRDSGLSSCHLSNLTSNSGPILADEFEASSLYEIRERINTLKFLEQASVDEEANRVVKFTEGSQEIDEQ
ncbi:unnamed protein product [Aureobasidium mustum]|uniref:F-box domain-containing protein n=1 Tax=Aureobasidium mustum TaxID=2773714 RepID=A0A9N8JX10_9PEZI|nr:unnamed protein product [Aureobasidium mustum]